MSVSRSTGQGPRWRRPGWQVVADERDRGAAAVVGRIDDRDGSARDRARRVRNPRGRDPRPAPAGRAQPVLIRSGAVLDVRDQGVVRDNG